jgi:capsular polysaccharide transport system permease protein
MGGIVMLALAFSVALRSPPIGTSFMFFYAIGIIPFSLYRSVERAASGAVRSNAGLLAYLMVTPLDAVLANFILGTLTMVVVEAILFTAIILVQDVHGVYRDEYVSVPYVLGIALGTFVIGAWLLRRHASRLIEQ